MKSLLRGLIILVLLVLFAILYRYRNELPAAMETLLGMQDPFSAAALFVLASSLGAIVLVPASLLMVLGGALFGFWEGLLLNALGFTLGACSAFLCSRYLAGSLVQRLLPERIWQRLDILHQHGWKLVGLLRLSGVIPSIILNYALGLTRLRFWEFLWPTAVFSLPLSMIFTYAGVIGIEFLSQGQGRELLLALMLLGVLGLLIYLLRSGLLRRLRRRNDSGQAG